MKNLSPSSKKQGAALLVSLWVLIILALIVGSFSFQVALEGMLVSRKKKQFKAEMLARSGVDYARAIIEQNQRARELEIEALEDDPDQFMQSALYVQRGYQPPQVSPSPIWVRFQLPLSQRKMVAM